MITGVDPAALGQQGRVAVSALLSLIERLPPGTPPEAWEAVEVLIASVDNLARMLVIALSEP